MRSIQAGSSGSLALALNSSAHNAGTTVTTVTPKPPKTAGERVTDEGDGGTKVADYLVSQKII